MKHDIVKVKELTQNKRKEGQYAKAKAKEKRPLVDRNAMDDKRWEIGGLIAVGAIIVIVILNLIK